MPPRLLVLLLALCAGPACTAATASEPGGTGDPAPNWVDPIAPFVSGPAPRGADEPPRGIDVRLYERQIDLREGRNTTWIAVEYAFLTRDGVADDSRFELTFDPGYETLVLHELAIQRNGETHDRLDTARIRLIDPEPDRDDALYYGRRALSVIVDDVRVGDVLRYAYTRDGLNPVLGGRREHGFRTEHRRHTDGRARLRVLSDPDAPLHVRVRGPAVTPAERLVDGMRETFVDLPAVPARPLEEGLPLHVRPRGRVVVSDVADWAGVVAWARPMYALSGPAPAELTAVAERIRLASADEPRRIGAALRWVQEEVRYVGLQLGAGSHRPATPAETLARRFGDCKGKALLLVALLAELGIEAHAALVDTDEAGTSPGTPWRLHAFDHVLVRVVRDGVSHWLDPTRAHQRGALGDIDESDHGRALVLAPGIDALEDMAPQRHFPAPFVDKRLVIPADTGARATLEVLTHWPPAHAHRIRARLEREGAHEVGRDWLAYYGRQFDGAERIGPLEALERDDGSVDTVERYSVPFWDENDAGRRWRWLRADEIDADPPAPPRTSTGRVGPFALAGLDPRRERWTVELTRPVVLTRADSTLRTPWFEYDETHTVDASGRTHVVEASFVPLADEVAPDALTAYADALERLSTATAFRIADERPPRTDKTGLDRFADALYEGHESRWRIALSFAGLFVLVTGWLHRYGTIRRVTD